jgi:hypothetical protein
VLESACADTTRQAVTDAYFGMEPGATAAHAHPAPALEPTP